MVRIWWLGRLGESDSFALALQKSSDILLSMEESRVRVTTGEIAEMVGGTLIGEAAVSISGVAPAASARAGDLTFAEKASFFEAATASEASAILIQEAHEATNQVLIQVPNVRVAIAQVLTQLYPEPRPEPGVHASAVVASGATIDPTASVGPGCVIGDGVVIGPRVILLGGNHVSGPCSIGEDSKLFPQVTVYSGTEIGRRVRIHAGTAIGVDGYGYVYDGSQHRKIPQVGGVVIGDDVEIGANVTIDRGALGNTMIGAGTKIDNLVQLAHNVVLGKGCLVISQTGIAGSTVLGDFVTVAGQVGIAGHLKIGDGATIAAQSGVMRDIPPGQKVFGSPAQGDRETKRQLLAIQKLPELVRRVSALERE